MVSCSPSPLRLPQGILNFCANNYLGLSSHPEVVQAGIDALKTHGAGLSSVRFICGTQVRRHSIGTSTAKRHPVDVALKQLSAPRAVTKRSLWVHRTYTKIWSRSWPSSTRGRTASSTPAVSMQTPGCLRYVALHEAETDPSRWDR